MSDTTATVRKEFLEDAKAEIQERIDDIKLIRDTLKKQLEAMSPDQYDIFAPKWLVTIDKYDKEIDKLLAEKENLPQVLFAGVPTDEEIITRRIEMASEGTYPSPIISGGEVLETTPQTGHDDIPF